MRTLEVDLIKLKVLLGKFEEEGVDRRTHRTLATPAEWYKQRNAAVAIGIHESSLYRKLKGEARFYLDELNGIARFLGIDVMEFLRFETGGFCLGYLR